MFETPSSGSIIMLIIVLALLYWTFKDERNEKKSHQYQRSQEKALLDNVIDLTTTRVKFERHLWIILDKVASYKLHRVVITDEKDIPQSVLLPYAEYKSFLDFKHLYEDNAEEKSKSIFCCNKSKEITNEF